MKEDQFSSINCFYSIEEMVSGGGEEIEKRGLSSLIKRYEAKISETNVPALKKAYELNKELLERLQKVTENIVNGNR